MVAVTVTTGGSLSTNQVVLSPTSADYGSAFSSSNPAFNPSTNLTPQGEVLSGQWLWLGRTWVYTSGVAGSPPLVATGLAVKVAD
jgi:hypothetical protein